MATYFRNSKRMKVSEKSLELNVGAELLHALRGRWGMHKAYLRGLTQREEHQEGVDFFAEMPSSTRIFAFQFKAPKRQWGDQPPYRFTIQRKQHGKLSALASLWPTGVYYVLPFYVLPAKLHCDLPHLLQDTWFLPVAHMPSSSLFGPNQTKTLRCQSGLASINPNYELLSASRVELSRDAGVPVRLFSEWYTNLHDPSDEMERKSPWLVRGMRVAIVQPESAEVAD